MDSTKSGSSPTFSQRRDGSEETVLDALPRSSTPQGRQCVAKDESGPPREEVRGEPLLPLLGTHLPDNEALTAAGQPASGVNDSASPLAADPRTVWAPMQIGRRSNNPQRYSRSDTSREIIFDILIEAIEISAEHNLGIVGSATTGRQQDPTEQDNQHHQRPHS